MNLFNHLKLSIMKNIRFLLLFTAIFSIIFATGCKKDDTAEPGNAKEFQLKSITVPDAMAQSSNQGAQMAVSYINMINGMSSYQGMMHPPGKSAPIHYKSGVETYTWDVNDNSGHYTATMTISDTPDKTIWDLYITGTMGEFELTNFHFIHATQKKDESGSDFLVYDPETGNEYMDISWNIMPDGSTVYEFEVFQETWLKVIINADGSGSIEFREWAYGDYVLTYKATWDTSGHGQYWEYEDGQVTDQGTW